jgi:AcrR family transcriptional regulator
MKTSRPETLDRMSDYVLAHGLAAATLRPLAHAAGTSDRMLIYHFGTKDGVIGALLDHLALRFTAILDAIPLPPQASAVDLVLAVLPLMQSPVGTPFAQLFLEVVAGSARGNPAFQAATARILLHFRGWIAARLPASDNGAEIAAFALGTIEGLLILGSSGVQGQALVGDALAGLRAAAGRPAS